MHTCNLIRTYTYIHTYIGPPAVRVPGHLAAAATRRAAAHRPIVRAAFVSALASIGGRRRRQCHRGGHRAGHGAGHR